MTEKVLEQLMGEYSLGRDLRAFLPELILCAGIVLLLLARLFRAFDRTHLGWAALIFTLGALGASFSQWVFFDSTLDFMPPEEVVGTAHHAVNLFGGMLVFETLTQAMRTKMPDVDPAYLLQPGELRHAFADWDILVYREGWTSPGDAWHRASASLVARRPA